MSNVIIVGDSWSSTHTGKTCWATQVAHALDDVTVTNLAYGGTGWHHWSTSGWNHINQLVPLLRASLVCITCGVNDLSDWTEPWVCAGAMREFVCTLNLRHTTPVMVSTYGAPPANQNPADWAFYNDHLDNIPGAISGFDGELLLDQPAHYDGLHPSQQGHDRIAWVMHQRIMDAV